MKSITINNVTKSQTEWARTLGITHEAFRQRLSNQSNNTDLLRPKRKKSNSKYRRRFGLSLAEISSLYGLKINQVHNIVEMLDRNPVRRRLFTFLIIMGKWE